MLLHYDWRGNVRELKNVLERTVTLRAVILADEETLPAEMLPAEFQSRPLPRRRADLVSRSLRGVEKRQIELELQKTAGNKAEAAR